MYLTSYNTTRINGEEMTIEKKKLKTNFSLFYNDVNGT